MSTMGTAEGVGQTAKVSHRGLRLCAWIVFRPNSSSVRKSRCFSRFVAMWSCVVAVLSCAVFVFSLDVLCFQVLNVFFLYVFVSFSRGDRSTARFSTR